MAIATATCPRCGRENELQPCPNDGSLGFHKGQLADGSVGMICDKCNLGWSVFNCQYADCNGAFSASLFGTPVSRIAQRMSDGMNAGSYGGTPRSSGGGCFIATEMYGLESPEVALLRRFRDTALLLHPLGRGFVRFYYRTAPRVVVAMRRSAPVRTAMRGLVAVAIRFVRAVQGPRA